MTRRWPRLLGAGQVVLPETILRWHRAGFTAFWRWKSRKRAGRPKIDRELRDLIRRAREPIAFDRVSCECDSSSVMNGGDAEMPGPRLIFILVRAFRRRGAIRSIASTLVTKLSHKALSVRRRLSRRRTSA